MNLTLGERLTVARKRCGLMKIEVAKIVLNPGAGKKPRYATIASWERGTIGVSLQSLRRLTDLYEEVGGVRPAWVILGDEPMLNSEP